MFDSWYEAFVLICCVWFSPNVLLCVMTKHLHFGLVSPKDIVPEVLWSVQMQLCITKLCCHVLFGETRLSLSALNVGSEQSSLLSSEDCVVSGDANQHV